MNCGAQQIFETRKIYECSLSPVPCNNGLPPRVVLCCVVYTNTRGKTGLQYTVLLWSTPLRVSALWLAGIFRGLLFHLLYADFTPNPYAIQIIFKLFKFLFKYAALYLNIIHRKNTKYYFSMLGAFLLFVWVVATFHILWKLGYFWMLQK